MKKVALPLFALFLVVLLCVVYSNQDDKKNDSISIILPIISLVGVDDKINAAFYEKGFDFKYDNLPTLTLLRDKDVLQIVLADNFGNAVTLGEDYYKYTDGSGICEKTTYELTKDDSNTVSLDISRRGAVKDEEAIYYLKNNQGTFVFRILFPLDIIDTK